MGRRMIGKRFDLNVQGSQSSAITSVKAATTHSNLYLWIDLKGSFMEESPDLVHLEITYQESDNEYDSTAMWYGLWDEMGSYVGETHAIDIITTNTSMEVRVELPAQLVNLPMMISGLEISYDSENVYLGVDHDISVELNPLLNTNLLASADANLMALCGRAMRDGIDYLQLADTQINARTDLLMHLIEYEPDSEFVEERAEALDAVAEFETFLNATNAWVTEVEHESTGEPSSYKSSLSRCFISSTFCHTKSHPRI